VELVGAGHILESALEMLRAENLEVLYPETIAAELVALRQQLDWLEVEWTRRVATFDEADGRHLEGHISTTAFLKHRCRMSAGRAQRAVALSHRLSSFQQTEKAFSDETVSLDQVRLVADVPERLASELSEFERH